MINTPQFLVSIQCMTYNHAPYIEDAMNGFCMQQTSFPYVAIIIDDASTDGEQEVIRRYLDANFDMEKAEKWETDDALFIYANHQNNNNCYFLVVLLKYNFWQAKKDKAPLYKEFEEKSKYIALCEGDDYWTVPEKLEKQIEILESNPNSSFCVHDYSEWDQRNMNYFIISHDNLSILEGKKKDSFFFCDMDDFLAHSLFTRTLTSVYRKSLLEKSKYNLYKVRFDMVLFFALLTQGNCIYINKVMGCYRHHDGGITNKKSFKKFQQNNYPKLFSLVKEEATPYARRFVYRHIRSIIGRNILQLNIKFIWLCIKYLGLRWNMHLFLCDFPLQVKDMITDNFTPSKD